MAKIIWRSIGIGIVVVICAFVFMSLFAGVFNGMPMEISALIGLGLFLAFEMTVCTGVILAKLEKQHQ